MLKISLPLLQSFYDLDKLLNLKSILGLVFVLVFTQIKFGIANNKFSGKIKW